MSDISFFFVFLFFFRIHLHIAFSLFASSSRSLQSRSLVHPHSFLQYVIGKMNVFVYVRLRDREITDERERRNGMRGGHNGSGIQ